MTARKDLTETQESFAYHVGSPKAFIGSRQVGHTEAIAHFVKARMEHGKVGVVTPTHRHAGDVLMPRVKNLVDLDQYERQYKTELHDDEGNGVVINRAVHNFTVSSFDAIAIDSVDDVEEGVFDMIVRKCLEERVDLGVAGTAKVGPSPNISKVLLNNDKWEIFFDRMDDNEFANQAYVDRMRDEFSGLHEMVEIDGMVVIDPSQLE